MLVVLSRTLLMLNSFVFTFAILHVFVFVFGMMNYGIKVRSHSRQVGVRTLLTKSRTMSLVQDKDSA